MKKYFFILKTELMTNLQYVINLLLGFVGIAIMLFIFFNLWNYIYDDPSELINGYNKGQMIWYVIITELLWSILGGRKLCRKIVEDVKGGNIVYNINKPYNYIGYLLFSHLGLGLIRFVIYTIIAFVLGYLFVGGFPDINILELLFVFITMIFATVINSLFIIFIGLLSFFFEDSNPIYWLYSKMILVLGTIFPIEYFPKVIQPILNYSPIYVTSYGPAKLFVDFSISRFLNVFGFQIIYLFIAILLCNLIYKKGVKNLNVNGG